MIEPVHLALEFLVKNGETPVAIRFHKKEAFDIYLHDHVVEVGLKSPMTPQALREAHKKIGAFLREKKIDEVYLPEINGDLETQLYALFEGNYRFERYFSEKSVFLKRLYLDVLPKNVAEILNVLNAQFMIKELLSTRYQDRKVADFVDYAKKLLHKIPNIELTVHDHRWLKKEGFHLHHAVGQGSETSDPPALLIIEYKGAASSQPAIGLVGKGMVFDTGGYSLKPSDGMLDMFVDCAGAVLYLHLAYLLAQLKVKKNVIFALPIADNSISSQAYRVSDVLVGRSKKSVEITNTDAEGRLILADSVAYMSEKFDLSCLVTAATLTGAVIVALGTKMAGLFSDNKTLRTHLLNAAEETQEPLWSLPFDKDSFMDLLKSEVADMKNAGKREASATQGAVFIYQHHMNDQIPFAHLDIAGPTSEKSAGTAYGLRLLLEFVTEWKSS